ncbi:hypothetical protein HPB51_025804 [Rhipicephalus microplus]|uniref:Uncharacterized protein n=1 Tax=Rhipicephalus microplus TaxID=6941 RepID=A0A9J6DE77_RHIMP|nr:hypothetical protein HPB51_025804 [Rhipicephalus microplus]
MAATVQAARPGSDLSLRGAALERWSRGNSTGSRQRPIVRPKCRANGPRRGEREKACGLPRVSPTTTVRWKLIGRVALWGRNDFGLSSASGKLLCTTPLLVFSAPRRGPLILFAPPSHARGGSAASNNDGPGGRSAAKAYASTPDSHPLRLTKDGECLPGLSEQLYIPHKTAMSGLMQLVRELYC